MPYSQESDLYAFGLPRGAAPSPARTLDSLLSDVCTLDCHGFATGDPIAFRGAGSGVLPAGLTAGTTYFAQRETEHTFKVRATAEGAALDITDADDPVVVISPLPIDSAIAWADAMIDDMLTPHQVPLAAPVPEIIRMTSAELAAGRLLALTGAASQSLSEIVEAAHKRLARWSKGPTVPGADPDTRDNLAIGVSTRCGGRGWTEFGGL